MITLLKKGVYTLTETKKQTKILTLDDNKIFAWIAVSSIGEILVTSHIHHPISKELSHGQYRIYSVSDEPKFVDQLHLELFVGEGLWQGYLLPTGLPTNEDKRNRIIPIKEIITQTPR